MNIITIPADQLASWDPHCIYVYLEPHAGNRTPSLTHPRKHFITEVISTDTLGSKTVVQAGFELPILRFSPFTVLGLQLCATMLSTFRLLARLQCSIQVIFNFVLDVDIGLGIFPST